MIYLFCSTAAVLRYEIVLFHPLSCIYINVQINPCSPIIDRKTRRQC